MEGWAWMGLAQQCAYFSQLPMVEQEENSGIGEPTMPCHAMPCCY